MNKPIFVKVTDYEWLVHYINIKTISDICEWRIMLNYATWEKDGFYSEAISITNEERKKLIDTLQTNGLFLV